MKRLSQPIILIITVLFCTAAAETAQDTIADAVQDAATAVVQDTVITDDAEATTPQDLIADAPQDIAVDSAQEPAAAIVQDTINMDIAQEEATAAPDLPRIAVYVTGNVRGDERTALGTRLLASLVNSGRYIGIERSNLFLAEIESEHVKQRSGAIDDNQISELGKQFGVKHICIADITPILGSNQISARIVDVETAEVIHIGEAYSPLRMVNDLTKAADEVVAAMFGEQAALKPQISMQASVKITLPHKPSFWAGIGLEALGVGILAYGLIENKNVGDHNNNDELRKAEDAVKIRNIAYAVGAAALLSGISIHIFF